MKQTVLKENPNIKFIMLSEPNSLVDGCWANDSQRVVRIGVGKDNGVTQEVALRHAEPNTLGSSSLRGTKLNSMLTFIIGAEPEKLKGFLHGLKERGVISEEERFRADKDLVDIRRQLPARFHSPDGAVAAIRS